MHPNDFDIGEVRALVDIFLSKDRDCPTQFRLHSRGCQADILSSLSTEGHESGETWRRDPYLIRGKDCWISESLISDKD